MPMSQDLICIDGKFKTVEDIESEIKSLKAENAFLKSVIKKISSVSNDSLGITEVKG